MSQDFFYITKYAKSFSPHRIMVPGLRRGLDHEIMLQLSREGVEVLEFGVRNQQDARSIKGQKGVP